MNVIGWDVGGANLKASDGDRRSVERPFELWKHPNELAARLGEMAGRFEPARLWALSMTGELADCFATKAEGVRHIVTAAVRAAGDVPVAVWTTPGEFVTPDDAVHTPILAAAANWQALATWAGRVAPDGLALLIDIGSTTTDIIPLQDGFPDPEGRIDVERLISGELVYAGVRRTPLNTLADSVTFRQRKCPLAAEFFASTLDLALLTARIPDDPRNCDTADGRPATRDAAQARLARMVCCDREECSLQEAQAMAEELWMALRLRISAAVARVARRYSQPPGHILLSGCGEYLAHAALDDAGRALESAARISLTHLLGADHAVAACAYALARLAGERVAVEWQASHSPTTR